ncbi:MAG: glycoside hydrolase family 3 C-terminal domain-containing protein [Lachnospiraceae bacterium]|nr:glycoside hydrolase family 3 C-terminal domain-containing protein [Lachnospiraceae bacterium]
MQLTQLEKEHAKKVRAMLAECMVLLKQNGDFPLGEAGELALYGSGARNTLRGGTGSGEVYSHFTISAEKGLERAGFTITTKAWLDAYDACVKEAKLQFIKDVKERAKRHHVNPVVEGMGAVMPEPEYEFPLDGAGDVALYVLSRICGEGNDRRAEKGDILLTDTEVRDILAIRKKYKKFLLVLNVGGPVDLTPVSEVENVLLLSQLGAMTGSGLADVVLGKKNPSGRLATTWAKWEDYPKIGDFGDRDDTRYREGIYVGYRYFDTVGKVPAYPFGYGLSYTEFEMNAKGIELNGEIVTVKLCVKNVGERAGKEVAQVYVSQPAGKLDHPYQMLAGFAKTKELMPGEQEELAIAFAMSDLASYDGEVSCYLLERGTYVVRLGKNSRDTVVCGAVQLKKDVVTRQVRHVLGTPDFVDYKPESVWEEKLPKDAKILTMNPGAITTEKIDYREDVKIDPELLDLTDEELIYLGIGAFEPAGGSFSVIGNAGKMVAGAAGETTGVLRDKGIPALSMADGPAGIRISKKYWVDENGAHSLGDPMLEGLAQFLPKPAAILMKLKACQRPKRGAEVKNQYCTAIPIGTAMAQSWNLKLAQRCGDIVGREMTEYGVDLWLAPALNIHRDIRCGRNFEYYSEDPVLSGKFAAAITNGVQRHPGRGVTIKHFAANNQETNRYYNNSSVSERAMREIYLKGFEICIRESAPATVMSSYNLLNGIHTSERRDLIDWVLRKEFGFQGIVMTDWIMGGTMPKDTAYPGARASRVAAAGGELIMPGSKQDFDDLKEALRAGRLTRKQLLANASRLYGLLKAMKNDECFF